MPDLYDTGAFLTSLGLVLDEVTGARVHGHLDLSATHHTPWGVAHGGAYTTTIESAASVGASAAVLDRGEFAVGVNNNTDFIRPVTTGRVEVLAEPINQGRVQQLWQVTISRAEDGKTVARGTVRLQNVPLPKS
ncbi:PaaI family thioesterase [Solihabitans fulvus]|uniref:PaaI family thioesterase n=1 Tax=Solihabitans fulvus TaxID=1892852 RepID=A0A5B2WK31_9PSEU|nr:PaaI family thioesterase [Solihabitans fulvus]